MLFVDRGGTATFASTLPANTFSGNTVSKLNNYDNCYKYLGTITGSCG